MSSKQRAFWGILILLGLFVLLIRSRLTTDSESKQPVVLGEGTSRSTPNDPLLGRNRTPQAQQVIDGQIKKATPMFSLEGRIRGQDGQPIAGTEVILCEGHGGAGDCSIPLLTALSADEGYYRFDLDFAQDKAVKAIFRKVGFKTVEERVWMMTPGRLLRNVVLTPQTAVLTGKVVDPQGKAVPRATVWVRARAGSRSAVGTAGLARSEVYTAPVVSQENGRFTVVDLSPGSVRVDVSADGYVRTSVETELKAEDNSLDITLERTIRVELLVCDQEGRPIPGANLGPPFGERRVAYSEPTDDEGRTRVFIPEDREEITIRIYARGFVSELATVSAAVSPVKVILQRAPLVTGSVKNKEGRPLPGCQILGTTPQRSEGRFLGEETAGRTSTDQNGNFALELNCESGVDIRVICPGLPFYRARIQAEEMSGGVDIRLRGPDAAISGRVVGPSGEPIPRFSLHVCAAAEEDCRFAEGYSFVFRFNDSSGFFVADLLSGSWRCSFASDNGRLRRDLTLQLRKGQLLQSQLVELHEAH